DVCGPERSAQRNFGGRLARGRYLLFVDSDMILERNVVADCVHTALSTDAPAVVVPETTIAEGFVGQCRQLERRCYVGDARVEAARFVERDSFEACGGFDECLVGPEDWDLSIRIARGRTLPRTTSVIMHDEGHVRLGTLLSKKRYYAPS